MKQLLQPGVYVVAVSGGVDSMVLLDLLRRDPSLKLIVAHYDHGIRQDSVEDRILVQHFAIRYGLPFVYDEGRLGPNASEATARAARYKFLHEVKRTTRADAIVTGHHHGDALETAVLNLRRGTHRRGLSSLKSTDIVKRPLLGHHKHHLVNYARANGLVWREDSTNNDTKYQRNHVRKKIIGRMSPTQRQHLGAHIARAGRLNDEIEHLLINLLHIQPSTRHIDRGFFARLPHDISCELMVAWLRRHGVRNITRRQVEMLVVAAKTLKNGRRVPVDKQHVMTLQQGTLALCNR